MSATERPIGISDQIRSTGTKEGLPGMSSRLTVVALGAVGAFAALTATAVGASAAPARHAAPAGSRHSHPPVRHVPARHVNLRGATHDLTAEIARLSRLQSGVATDTRISSTDTSALSAALGADLAAVKSDLAGLAGATTQRQVNAIVSAAHTTGELAAGQYVVVAAAGTVESQIETAAAGQETLSGQVAAVAANGTDVSTENAQLADIGNQLTAASGDVSAAMDTALTVAPTAGRGAVHAAFWAAEADFVEANVALHAASADAASISTELAGLPAPTPAPAP